MAERERAEGMSGEDAAWRDLVARFDLPGRPDDAAPPWPAREDLPAARHQQASRSADIEPGQRGAAETGTEQNPGTDTETDTETETEAKAETGTETEAGPSADAGSGAGAGERQDPGPADGPADRSDQAAAGQAGPAEIAIPDRMRVIKPAFGVQLPAADEDEEDHYIPPPPPPLPALDPVAKGAWTALFGGPAYLLIATSAGWVLPGWATFGAVGAFVGGFAVLVIRMGDKPSRGSGPDNGAVL